MHSAHEQNEAWGWSGFAMRRYFSGQDHLSTLRSRFARRFAAHTSAASISGGGLALGRYISSGPVNLSAYGAFSISTSR